MSTSTLLRTPTSAPAQCMPDYSRYEEDNRIFTPEQMDEHAEYLLETAAGRLAA